MTNQTTTNNQFIVSKEIDTKLKGLTLGDLLEFPTTKEELDAKEMEIKDYMDNNNLTRQEAIFEINHATVRHNICRANLELGEEIIKQYDAEFKMEVSASSEDIYFKCYIENQFDYFTIGFVVDKKNTIEQYCEQLNYATEDLTATQHHTATQNEIVFKTLGEAFGTIYVNDNDVWFEDSHLYIEYCTNIKINYKQKTMTFDYSDDDETFNYWVDLQTGIIDGINTSLE